MKLPLIFTLLPLLAAAASTTKPHAPHRTRGPFTVISARSASPIHFIPMVASDQAFWLGGTTSSFCPLSSGCPPGKETAFARGGSALDVEVPGGQKVYVSSTGALSFTKAHSANIPPDSFKGRFTYKPGNPFGHYSFTGSIGESGFMACPAQDGRWQVFVPVPNVRVPEGRESDCLGFDALAVAFQGTGPAAWQYT